MLIIRDFSNRFQQISGMPINSKGGKDMLKRAGIDTNSKQYQAVMKSMKAGQVSLTFWRIGEQGEEYL